MLWFRRINVTCGGISVHFSSRLVYPLRVRSPPSFARSAPLSHANPVRPLRARVTLSHRAPLPSHSFREGNSIHVPMSVLIDIS